jgi:hypothetical protein
MKTQRKLWKSGSVALVVLGCATIAAADPPLRRDLGSYFIFAMRSVSGKNIRLLSACNIGVNCAQPSTNSSCGVMTFEDAFFEDGSQIAADKGNFNKAFADAYQVFVNKGAPFPNLMVRHPPIESFATPIIPGTCDSSCNGDAAAIGALCGLPSPYPTCNPARPVTAKDGQDCDPTVYGVDPVDAVLNNGRCDLNPGTWGDVQVQNQATINFVGGTYNVCSFTMGKNAIGDASSPVILNIAEAGTMRVNNGSKFGAQCGDFTVNLKGAGSVNFGRNGAVAAKVCAPAADINLGHNNNLLGQFVGDTVTADRDNDGRCCGGCTCFDSFSPTTAKPGDVITLISQCDLNNATAVRICGQPAMILTKTATNLTVTVPNVGPGPCMIEVDSAAGTFKAFGTLTVQ